MTRWPLLVLLICVNGCDGPREFVLLGEASELIKDKEFKDVLASLSPAERKRVVDFVVQERFLKGTTVGEVLALPAAGASAPAGEPGTPSPEGGAAAPVVTGKGTSTSTPPATPAKLAMVPKVPPKSPEEVKSCVDSRLARCAGEQKAVQDNNAIVNGHLSAKLLRKHKKAFDVEITNTGAETVVGFHASADLLDVFWKSVFSKKACGGSGYVSETLKPGASKVVKFTPPNPSCFTTAWKANAADKLKLVWFPVRIALTTGQVLEIRDAPLCGARFFEDVTKVCKGEELAEPVAPK